MLEQHRKLRMTFSHCVWHTVRMTASEVSAGKYIDRLMFTVLTRNTHISFQFGCRSDFNALFLFALCHVSLVNAFLSGYRQCADLMIQHYYVALTFQRKNQKADGKYLQKCIKSSTTPFHVCEWWSRKNLEIDVITLFQIECFLFCFLLCRHVKNHNAQMYFVWKNRW